MANVLNNCFARIRFTALGGRYEKLISLCLEQGIPIAHVKPIPGGFTAAMPARYYRKLFGLARRCRTRLQVKKKRGLYFRFKHYRGRWGMVAGPLVFLIAINLFGKVVWAIRWDDLSKVQQSQVNAALYSMDIYEGAILTQEKIQLAEKQLLDHSDELGWVALNFEKGRLVVEAAAAREKPIIESNDAVDIIAAADGVILETNVQEGFLQKKAGQTVAQGEVLISSVLPGYDLIPISSHAKGNVLAAVKKVYNCSQPLFYSAQTLTGQVNSGYTLRLGNRRFSLGKQPENNGNAKIRHEALEVLGFGLPVTIEEVYTADAQNQDFVLSEEAALEYARYSCRQQLYSEFPGAEILAQSEQYAMGENALEYALTVEFKADIARTATN